jgi:hypothetical protein
MFNENHRQIFILLILFFTTNLISAQLTPTVNIASWYDDNLYRTPEKIDDIVTNFDLQFDFLLSKSDINFYLNGSYFLYNTMGIRNFYMNSIGFNMVKNIDTDELYKFYLGVDWTFRLNNEDYNYYDYHQIYAYNNLTFNLDWIFLRGGYNYRYRNYSNIPDLNNHQIYGFLQLNKSFETRTTFIIETDIGYKSFAGKNFATYERSVTTGGKGHGRMADSTTTTTISTIESEIPSLSQAVLLVRIAQSLHTKLGIYIQYRKQISLTEETSYINSDNYYQDEELFDDPFSYESDTYSSQLTWMMPWQMKIQLGGSIVTKNYISEIAYESIYDTTGLAGIRADDQSNFFINFTKTFYLNKIWMNSVNFDMNYSYIRNESKSYWYDYENAVITGSIRIIF